MENELNGIIRVTRKDLRPAAATLARAFREYPLTAFLIPDAVNRIKKQIKGFEGSLCYGIEHGEVYTTSDKLEGVAIWFLSDGEKATPKQKSLRQWLTSLFADKTQVKREQAFTAYVDEVRKRLIPGRHWYLQVLGVGTAYQGRGFSSRLVIPMLARADREGLPCFLDTQAEKNLKLYEHFGFRVVEEGTIPGSNVKSWAMVRDAKKG
jgi:ribosomal protein S18 acetylase RimI-like enzyme